MSLQDTLREHADVAFAFAAALERGMGDDALLTIALTRTSVAEVLPGDQVRAAELPLTLGDGTEATLLFVGLQPFIGALERTASDEILLTALAPALEAGAHALAALASQSVETFGAEETNLASVNDVIGDEAVVYPILDGTTPVACLAVAFGPHGADGNAGARPRGTGDTSSAAGANAPLVLADVEMGVTAELGRCRMSIRELLSLTPGAVIDLDRAAGAPVDVLVNGTLIARGEVVVIEEEFGIRISEILTSGSPR
jgi:flagellar motor switch protein FliN/FliY